MTGSTTPATTTSPTRRRLALAVTALAAAALALIPAGAAAARTPTGWVSLPGIGRMSVQPATFSQCPSGSVCLWENANYAGRILVLDAPSMTYNSLASLSFDNIMSSWANLSSVDARWFYNANLGGTTRCMNAASSNPNVGATDNDQASSVRVYSDDAACS